MRNLLRNLYKKLSYQSMPMLMAEFDRPAFPGKCEVSGDVPASLLIKYGWSSGAAVDAVAASRPVGVFEVTVPPSSEVNPWEVRKRYWTGIRPFWTVSLSDKRSMWWKLTLNLFY